MELLDDVEWVPVVQAFPNYMQLYDKVAAIDKYGMRLLSDVLQLRAQDTFVAMMPIPMSPAGVSETASAAAAGKGEGGGKVFPYAMAWPFTVVRGATDGGGVLAHGALLTLTDMFTSLHMMLALLPAMLGHVSVSLQCNTPRPMREGEKFVAVTRIDKMGKRLMFSTVEFLCGTPAAASAEQEKQMGKGEAMETGSGIATAVRGRCVCANAKHVKAMLPPNVATTKPS
ncbi:thioesterase superfamily protein [Trypanosoma grayi]|uniref:thioesterase superfamily protein n=1 Tax=Trypanosoma grayi TaxID=71804 RepID=UPI0004F42EBD|nr:thioesterase superfamily protein [Trypanosoma grayi]KEG08798.1 thioesterase superfamily protein [Trypanosoma grayi]